MRWRRPAGRSAGQSKEDTEPLPEIGRFEVLEVLGAGSEGVVLLVHDRADASQEPLGLKVARRMSEDPDAMARLRDEARILAWLCHHNIVQVHRLLEKDGVPIVVMEYVEGASAVEQLAVQRDGLPAPVAVEIALRSAIALEAAYNAPGPDGRPMRIVHRDIKPANLLVSVDGQVKVVDFGIATGAFAGGGATDESGFMGTPGYVAPERRNGGADSPAVDVYALGASLYGMLTGRVLVQSMSPTDHDPSVARALVSMPSPQKEMVQDLCRYDPSRRPGLEDLVERLDALRAALGPPDMRAYAREHVARLLASRPGVHPRSHPLWPNLAFLETGGEVQDLAVATARPPRELALRASNPPEHLGPLLEVLQRASATTPASELVAALDGIRGTRDPHAVTLAFELTGYADPSVSEAAWRVLDAAC